MKYNIALILHPEIHGLKRESFYMFRKNDSEISGIPVQLTHFYKDHIRFKVLSNPNRKSILKTFHKKRMRRQYVPLNKWFGEEIEYFRLDYVNMNLYTITPIEFTDLPKHIATASPQLFKIFE